MTVRIPLLRIQGTYYVLTGVWPVLHMASFEAVTGPKTDDWLVRMVGLLAATIGATLLVGARRARVSREVVFLAVASAAAFTSVDVYYALRGTISSIYLVDAIVEVVLVAALLRRNGTV